MGFAGRGVAALQVGERDWQLLEPLEYHGCTQSFVVPSGFRTDFASVPRPLVWFVPRYGTYTKAAILHDYLRVSQVVSVADSDGIFRRTLREAGVSIPRRWMMWAAVRFASRLVGISLWYGLLWLLVAGFSVVFLAIPALVVLVFSLLFWVVELIAWGIGWFFRPEPPPVPDMRSV